MLLFLRLLTDLDFFWFHFLELHETHRLSTQIFEILSQTLFMIIYANLSNLFKNIFKMLLFLKKLMPFQLSSSPEGAYITHRLIYSFTCLINFYLFFITTVGPINWQAPS